jgi:hypothetical protein
MEKKIVTKKYCKKSASSRQQRKIWNKGETREGRGGCSSVLQQQSRWEARADDDDNNNKPDKPQSTREREERERRKRKRKGTVHITFCIRNVY